MTALLAAQPMGMALGITQLSDIIAGLSADTLLQAADLMFTPFVFTLSDFILLLYLCRNSLNTKRSVLQQVLILFLLLLVTMAAQFALNGIDGQEGSIYVWMIVKYLMLCAALKLYTTLPPRAIFYYAAILLLAMDLCLLLIVRLELTLFGEDMLTMGTILWERAASHAALIGVKAGALLLIERFMPPLIYGINNVRKALIVVLPTIPYIYMRDFPLWLDMLPRQIPGSVQFMTMLTGVCALIIMVGNERVTYQTIQSEKQRVDDIIRRRHEQLIVHSNAVEEVNRRYHDLKHMLLGIEGMQGAEEIKSYVRSLHTGIHAFEDYFDTGNETMDVVLTDKARICRDKGIGLIPIVNAQGWEDMPPIGISTIFGNALDNSIEAAERIERDEKRRVTVRVGRVNQMLVARFENYYEHELCGDLPELQTTKPHSAGHGYGIRSIRNVVDQLEGELTITAQDGRFVLTVLIPIP